VVTKGGAGRKGLRVRGSALLEFLGSRTDGGPKPMMTYKHLAKYLN
jgi:hypothetical protein